MRQEKIAILKEITDRLRDADSTIVLAYGGLKVDELAELRKAIQPLEGRCLVAKNTLVKKAVEGFEPCRKYAAKFFPDVELGAAPEDN